MIMCYFKKGMCLCVLSHVWLFVTPWTVAHQAPLSILILQPRTLEWVSIPFPNAVYDMHFQKGLKKAELS